MKYRMSGAATHRDPAMTESLGWKDSRYSSRHMASTRMPPAIRL